MRVRHFHPPGRTTLEPRRFVSQEIAPPFPVEARGEDEEVLVPPARHVDDDRFLGGEGLREGEPRPSSVRRFEGEDDPLACARRSAPPRGLPRPRRRVNSTRPRSPRWASWGPMPRVVETRRDGVGGTHLTVVVEEKERLVAVNDPGSPARRPFLPRAPPAGFPFPPASAPMRRGAERSEKGEKKPIAFEPPPTQATRASGSRRARPGSRTLPPSRSRPETPSPCRGRARARGRSRGDSGWSRSSRTSPASPRLWRPSGWRPARGGRRASREPPRPRSSSIQNTFGLWRRMSVSPM